MGQDFDGGYAEYTSVPANQVQVIRTPLAWQLLGALPEMLQTAWRQERWLLEAVRLLRFSKEPVGCLDSRLRVLEPKIALDHPPARAARPKGERFAPRARNPD